MSDDEPVTVRLGIVIWLLAVVIFAGVMSSGYYYSRGLRSGACVEMCRPAKFDADQEVNGGCLCIGSDEVLRFRKAP